MLPPTCFIPPVPRCTLCKGYQSSSKFFRKIQYNTANLYWHIMLASYFFIFTCNKRNKKSDERTPFEKKGFHKPFPFQLGLSSRHEVCTYCCGWPFNLRLALTVKRTDKESCISYLVSSTPLPWDQAGQKCLQRREKGQPLIKCFNFSIGQCSGCLARLYRNGGHSQVLTEVRVCVGGWWCKCWDLPRSGRSAYSQVRLGML